MVNFDHSGNDMGITNIIDLFRDAQFIQLEKDITTSYEIRMNSRTDYAIWMDRMNGVSELVVHNMIGSINRMIKIVSFSTRIAITGNYYIWNYSIETAKVVAKSFMK